MKHLLLYTILLFSSFTLYSQIRAVDIQLNHLGEIPLTLAELISFGENLEATLINETDNDISVFLAIQVYKNGELFVYTNPMYRGLEQLLPVGLPVAINQSSFPEIGVSTFLQQVNPPEFREFTGITRLDPGSYEVCVVAYDANTTSRNFQLSDAHPITCTLPIPVIQDAVPQGFFPDECADITDTDEPLEFLWDSGSLSNDLNETVDYTLKVVDVSDFASSAYDHIVSPGTEVVIEKMIDEQSITSNIISINPIEYPDLIIGNTYAWWIDVTLPERIGLSNEVYSSTEVMVFQYGKCDELYGEDDDAGSDGEENYIPEYTCENCDNADENLEDSNLGDKSVKSFTAGFFKIELNNVISHNDDSGISGEGKTKMELFEQDITVKVIFQNVLLNKKNQMKSGLVKVYNNDIEDHEEYMNEHFDFGDIESLISNTDEYRNFKEGIRTVRQIVAANNGKPIGLPFGIDQIIDGQNMSLLITDIRFESSGAKMQSIFDIKLPGPDSPADLAEEKYVAFGLSDICFTPVGFTNNLVVHSTRDISIYEGDNLNIRIIGCESSKNNDCSPENVKTSSTFVEFGCEGIEGVGLRFAVDFPSNGLMQPYFSEHMMDKIDISKGNGDKKTEHFTASQLKDIEQVTAEFGLLFGNKKKSYRSSNHDQVIEKGFDWMVSLDITPFQFSFMPDFGYSIEEAWLDMSATQNPRDLVFPEGHHTYGNRKIDGLTGIGADVSKDNKMSYNMDNLWTGLFIKRANIWLPQNIGGKMQKSVFIENLIYDFEGEGNVCVDAGIAGILDKRNFRADNWGLGIDELRLKILNSNFSETSFTGPLETSFLKEDFKYLAKVYQASEEELGYLFTMSTSQEENKVKIPFLLATANLKKESHITIAYDKIKYSENDGFNFIAALAGDLTINPEEANWAEPIFSEQGIPSDELPINMVGIPFVLQYSSENEFRGSYFGLTAQMIVMAEQKFKEIETKVKEVEETLSGLDSELTDKANGVEESTISGFRLSIENVAFDIAKTNPSLTFEPRLIVMGEDDESFGIDTKIELHGATNRAGKLVLDKISVGCGGIDARVRNISFRGEVCYQKNGSQKEFQGKLAVDAGKWGAAMVGGFGTEYGSSENNAQSFNYWHLAVMSKYKKGIVIPGTDLSLYGLGGGFFWNYEAENFTHGRDFLTIAPETAYEEVEEASIYRHILNKPKNGVFKADLYSVFGMTGIPDLINFDLGISYSLAQNVSRISVQGDLYALTSDMWKSNSYLEDHTMVKGKLTADLTFGGGEYGNFIIDATSKTNINIPVDNPFITTGNNPGDNAHLYYNRNAEHFHLHMGVPSGHSAFRSTVSGPVGIKAKLGDVTLASTEGYFMIGDGMPTRLSLPTEIKNWHTSEGTKIVGKNKNEISTTGGVVDPSSQMNNTRPFNDGRGLALGAKIEGGFKVSAGDKDCFSAAMRAIIGFDLNITHSPTSSCGHEGWYAMGNMYAGLSGALKLFCLTIADFSALASVSGGFPNTTWVRGEVSLRKKKFVVRRWIEGGWKFITGGEGSSDYTYRSIDLEIGTPCGQIGSSTYKEPDIQYIKSVSVADGQENLDYKEGEIVLNLAIKAGNRIPYPVVEYVSNPFSLGHEHPVYSEVLGRVELRAFELNKGHQNINSVHWLPASDQYSLFYSNLEPDTWYTVKVNVALFHNSIIDSQTKTIRFKTRKIDLSESVVNIVASNPAPYQLFAKPDELELGGFIRLHQDFAQSLESDPVNSITDIINANLNVSDNSNGYFIILKNLVNDTEVEISPSYYSGTINFDLPDLENETSYELTLSKKMRTMSEPQSSTWGSLPGGIFNGYRYVDVVQYSFRTSKFDNNFDKFDAIIKENGKMILAEPFDEYEKNSQHNLQLKRVYHPESLQIFEENISRKASEIKQNNNWYVFPQIRKIIPSKEKETSFSTSFVGKSYSRQKARFPAGSDLREVLILDDQANALGILDDDLYELLNVVSEIDIVENLAAKSYSDFDIEYLENSKAVFSQYKFDNTFSDINTQISVSALFSSDIDFMVSTIALMSFYINNFKESSSGVARVPIVFRSEETMEQFEVRDLYLQIQDQIGLGTSIKELTESMHNFLREKKLVIEISMEGEVVNGLSGRRTYTKYFDL